MTSCRGFLTGARKDDRRPHDNTCLRSCSYETTFDCSDRFVNDPQVEGHHELLNPKNKRSHGSTSESSTALPVETRNAFMFSALF